MGKNAVQHDRVHNERLLLTWYEDLESPESEATKYASMVTLRVILENLSAKERKHFMVLLETDPEEAKAFADKTISDLTMKITSALAKGLQNAIEKGASGHE